MPIACAAAGASLAAGALAWWLAAWAADRAVDVFLAQLVAALTAAGVGFWAGRRLRPAAGWGARVARGIAALGAIIGLTWLGSAGLLYVLWPR